MRSQARLFTSAQKAAIDRLLASYSKNVSAQPVPPSSISMPQFISGIVKWLNIANTPYHTRGVFADDKKMRGLFYPQEFKKFMPDVGSALPLLGFSNPEYWDIAKSRQHLLFEARTSHTPSNALAAFFQGPTFADCGTVLQACIYKSIEEMIGTVAFDHVFGIGVTPFLITSKLFNKIPTAQEQPRLSFDKRMSQGNPLFFLFDELPWNETTMIAAGDIVYISGVDKYNSKHYTGAARGWNLICLENIFPKFVFNGFGPAEFTQPLTFSDIKTLLIREYNQEQSEDTLAAYNDAMADYPDDTMFSMLMRTLPFTRTKDLAHDTVAADYPYVGHEGAIMRLNIDRLQAFVAARLSTDAHLQSSTDLQDYIPYADLSEILLDQPKLSSWK